MMALAEPRGAVRMTLSELLDMPGCDGADTMISGLQLDSRAINGGDLFVALPGDAHDGREFIEQAVANGAAAVVAEPPVAGYVDELHVPVLEIPELRLEVGFIAARFYAQPSQGLHVVGVTGTNGKTTVSRLIGQLSRRLDKTCGVIGTLGATLDDSISEAGNTTPDPIALQRQLAQWRDARVSRVAMEVSSHALVQGRVNAVAFETAVFTNLSHDHLDYHGTMEAYGRAKLQLFAVPGLRFAIVNVDDPFAQQVLAVLDAQVRVLTCSTAGAPADIRIDNARFSDRGVHADFFSEWGNASFFSALPGDFNLANVAAAISVMLLAGEPLARTLAAVADLHPVAGRMQSIPNELGIQVIVDYAHTPDALEQVLAALAPQVDGALCVVFGCGGDRDNSKRQVMGRVACAGADRVYVTSDNPRSENPQHILGEIAAGCSGDYRLVENRADAINQAIQCAMPGDCVLIAGKGHECYQIVEAERVFFSDAQQAELALARRAAS
tara:strand:- start:229922 stop:231415 length:1494 start_codon:yes stop_codon:yes gene_type:complete